MLTLPGLKCLINFIRIAVSVEWLGCDKCSSTSVF